MKGKQRSAPMHHIFPRRDSAGPDEKTNRFFFYDTAGNPGLIVKIDTTNVNRCRYAFGGNPKRVVPGAEQ
jgi:hypothetical protein